MKQTPCACTGDCIPIAFFAVQFAATRIYYIVGNYTPTRSPYRTRSPLNAFSSRTRLRSILHLETGRSEAHFSGNENDQANLVNAAQRLACKRSVSESREGHSTHSRGSNNKELPPPSPPLRRPKVLAELIGGRRRSRGRLRRSNEMPMVKYRNHCNACLLPSSSSAGVVTSIVSK